MKILNTAKKLAMKNKDKVASGVNKATNVIDKKTGGKHTDKLKKLDDAAAKFAGQPPVEKTSTPDPEQPESRPAVEVQERDPDVTAPTPSAQSDPRG